MDCVTLYKSVNLFDLPKSHNLITHTHTHTRDTKGPLRLLSENQAAQLQKAQFNLYCGLANVTSWHWLVRDPTAVGSGLVFVDSANEIVYAKEFCRF